MPASSPRIVGIVCLIFFTVGCAGDEPTTLERLVPGLPADFTRHVQFSDDDTFRAFVREEGLPYVSNCFVSMRENLSYLSPETYLASTKELFPFMERTARAAASELDYEGVLLEFEALRGYTPAVAIRERQCRLELNAITTDTSSTPALKIEKAKGLLREVEKMGLLNLAVDVKNLLASLHRETGNTEQVMAYSKSAIEDCRRKKRYTMLCQELGFLGSVHGENGDVDSLNMCWSEATEIANRYRLPNQAARICTFYANRFKRQGRLSLAYTLYNESQELCREYKGGYYEIRYVQDTAQFHADLGSWEIVKNLLRRARSLENRFIGNGGGLNDAEYKTAQHWVRMNDRLEARYYMTRGEVAEAEAIFKKISHNNREPWEKITHPAILFDWARGLVDNKRGDKALPIIRDGLRASETIKLPALASQFLLLMAEAHFQLGEVSNARDVLSKFGESYDKLQTGERSRLQPEKIIAQSIKARLLVDAGESDQALATLVDCLGRIEQTVAGLEGGTYGDLWIGRYGHVRRLLLDLTAYDPELEYGAVLYWRSLRRLVGRKNNAAVPFVSILDSPSLNDFLRALAEKAAANAANSGATLLAYTVKDEHIRRWTVSRGEIRRDVIVLPARELKEYVSRAWENMSRDPGDPDAVPSSRLVENLYILARNLLPAEVLDIPTGIYRRPLLFSVDDFLGRIPLEALNIGSTENYVPLLSRYDVAYLRYAENEHHGRVFRNGVVLAAPSPSPRHLKRYPYLGDLKDAMTEGEFASALFRDAVFLHGATATKKNLMERWENAGVIYIAAHVLQDPEVPYLNLIPLAEPVGPSGPEDLYLDATDIRAADLGRCDLVVLSGCSSGAPYLGAAGAAPCIGDAFLDSGAGAVVQTFWDVGDAQARELMIAFIQALNHNPSKIHTLSDVRRGALHGPSGIRHPFNWAAFSIQLGGI